MSKESLPGKKFGLFFNNKQLHPSLGIILLHSFKPSYAFEGVYFFPSIENVHILRSTSVSYIYSKMHSSKKEVKEIFRIMKVIILNNNLY